MNKSPRVVCFLRRVSAAYVSAVAAVFAFGTFSVKADVTYAITDLGDLNGTASGVVDFNLSQKIPSSSSALNAFGQVVGAFTQDNGHRNVLFFDNTLNSGTLTINLGFSPSKMSAGFGVNSAGQIVGLADIPGSSDHHAFAMNTAIGMSSFVDLGVLPGGKNSVANSINKNGLIVGYSESATGIHAFTIDHVGSPIKELKIAGTGQSRAIAVNDAGEVVGFAQMASTDYHGFVSKGVSLTKLDTFGGRNSYALGISNNHIVAGYAETAAGSQRAFLTSGTRLIDLGTIGGKNSYAVSVNNLGQAVGYADTASGSQHAFFYNGTSMKDLNTLTISKSGWLFQIASGINDLGQIVGNGVNPAGMTHAFLLTPFTKYKQFSGGPWADPKAGGGKDQYVNPDYTTPGYSTFTEVGCTVTSLATICTLEGLPTDPLTLRTAMLSAQPPLIDNQANASVSGFTFTWNGLTLKEFHRGHDFKTLVSEANNIKPILSKPVLLGVPWEETEAGKPNLHYIVAYGTIGNVSGNITASNILISDPGDGNTFYQLKDKTYNVDKEATLGITLQDYFDALNYWEQYGSRERPVGHKFHFDSDTWFAAGAVTTNSQPFLQVGPDKLNELITTFERSTSK